MRENNLFEEEYLFEESKYDGLKVKILINKIPTFMIF